VLSFVDPDNLIKKHHLGMVVKDLDEMAAKVNDMIENKLNFSSEKIKRFFEKNLTIEKAVDKYEELFDSLLVQHKSLSTWKSMNRST
jgi:glycosyltransferase involved in cell wall biosynthesis